MVDFSLNRPFGEVARQAKKAVEAGMQVNQKFTCGKCGARQTIPIPNKFFTGGQCEECSYITDLTITGCGFSVIFELGQE